jgi:hypothetical protein
MGLFTGTQGKWEQRSTLGKEQQPLYQQMLAAMQGQGAGGAFGASADYYRDLLSDDSNTFNAYAAPEMRRFNEEIIPGLSEQFAGMGSGGLSSSGFRNASVNAGTDLSERLGAIRAQLRQQGAQGLNQMGQFGLGQFNENIYQKGQPGLIDFAGPALGVAGAAFGGTAGAAAGNMAGNWLSNKFGSQKKQDTSSLTNG